MCLFCGRAICRSILFIFNLILLFLTVMLILVVTGYAKPTSKLRDSEELLPNTIYTQIIGYVLLATAVLGLLGTFCDWKCFYLIYAILMFLILVGLILLLGAIYAHGKGGHVQDFINDALTKSFDNYDKSKESQQVVDYTQAYFKCCGLENAQFWKSNIPRSCCKKDLDNKCDAQNAFPDGCLKKITDSSKSNLKTVGIIMGALCIVALAAALFSLCLFCTKFPVCHQEEIVEHTCQQPLQEKRKSCSSK